MASQGECFPFTMFLYVEIPIQLNSFTSSIVGQERTKFFSSG